MDVLFSTGNSQKFNQVKEVVKHPQIDLYSLKDADIQGGAVEDGKTLEENAIKKSYFAWSSPPKGSKWHSAYIISEDTGLFIDALNGAPGVVTAEWAGKDAEGKTIKGMGLREFAIEQIKKIPEGERSATWRTVATLREPSGNLYVRHGELRGSLIHEPRGAFIEELPYSQLFVPEGYHETLAELLERGNPVETHRTGAFIQILDILLEILNNPKS
jgi:XTP/dITP diphosphohydrolase